ncbi:putative RNA-binding domain superfamily [Helianthus anomalus]
MWRGKRDKNGFRFGFVSFKGVKDVANMEKNMKNVWMGSFKLFINIARFALDNKGGRGIQKMKTKIQEQEGIHNGFKEQGEF